MAAGGASKPPERDGWTQLAKVGSPPEAALIEGLLESAGIEAELESQVFTQEPVTLGLLGTVKVWVRSDHYQQARELLDEASLEEGSSSVGEPQPSDREAQ